MTINPNWPVLDVAISWAAGRLASPVQDSWSSVLERTEGKLKITRGKTYELDQIQPGQLDLTLRNDDGALDPSNPASPYAGYVLPYRLLRVRAQWPPTVNLIDTGIAVPASGALPAHTYLWSGAASVTVVTLSGINWYAIPIFSFEGVLFTGVTVTAGKTYTASLSAAASVAGQRVQVGIQWVNIAGTVIGSATFGPQTIASTSTAAPTRLSFTSTAPAAAVGGQIIYQCVGSVGATMWCTQIQWEQAASASSFVAPGTWYSLFTGFIERWPQSWSSGGNYGTSDLTAVDLFGLFASVDLQDPFTMDLLALGPNFLYPLNEQAGSLSFRDVTGNRAPITVLAGQKKGSISSGAQITSNDDAPQGPDRGVALSGGFYGGAGPAVHTDVYAAGQTASAVYGGALAIPPNSSNFYGPPQFVGWTRLVAARATGMPGSGKTAYMWSYNDLDGMNIGALGVAHTDMLVFGTCQGPGAVGGGASTADAPNLAALGTVATSAVVDGDWHLFGLALTSDGLTLHVMADGQTAWSSGFPIQSAQPQQLQSGAADVVGAGLSSSGQVTSNWMGELAYVCELPFVVTQAQWKALAQGWRNNYAGDSTGSRYSRILAWIGVPVPTAVDTGRVTNMGPATDIVGSPNPTKALQALQNVVDTENGQHYIAGDGSVVFLNRARRFSGHPAVIFGEQSGEVAYLSAVVDNDPTRVGNVIQVTQTFGGGVYVAADATSRSQYGSMTLQRDMNSLDADEVQAAAQFLAYVFAQPVPRLESITVDAAAQPAAWPSLLALELNSCAQVNRRPSNAPAMSITGWVEQVTWEISDTGAAVWTGQITNGARQNFAVLDDSQFGLLDSTAILGY